MLRSQPDPTLNNIYNANRTVVDLRELHVLTGDENGAQCVAFTHNWSVARAWFQKKLEDLPVETHTDEAGNFWSTLHGDSEACLLIGGHLDSVPNGGWLDGTLNMMAGLESLRWLDERYYGRPPVTVRLVDWVDEEGVRFGKSSFGSSAVSGNLDVNKARTLVDRYGNALPDVLKTAGVDFERVKHSNVELRNAAAYLELHIEQGPVLFDLDLALGSALGTFGVERHGITFYGQAAHSGNTPMDRRKDAFLAAAIFSLEIYRIADRSKGGVCTVGSCTTKPGIVTSVVEECRITLDQRHLDADVLACMFQEAKDASEKFAVEGNVTVLWERLLRISPCVFNGELIALCDDSIRETCGKVYRLPSGSLHDAAGVAAAGAATVMMFVKSLYGISHNNVEATKE